jgi:hypothetical protein
MAFSIQSGGDAVKFLSTRLAVVDLEINLRLEKGDINEAEAEELRDNYVTGVTRNLFHDESI